MLFFIFFPNFSCKPVLVGFRGGFGVFFFFFLFFCFFFSIRRLSCRLFALISGKNLSFRSTGMDEAPLFLYEFELSSLFRQMAPSLSFPCPLFPIRLVPRSPLMMRLTTASDGDAIPQDRPRFLGEDCFCDFTSLLAPFLVCVARFCSPVHRTPISDLYLFPFRVLLHVVIPRCPRTSSRARSRRALLVLSYARVYRPF